MVALHALTLALSLSGAGDTVLLEFTADWCGACQTVAPTVRRLMADGYPVRQVNIDQDSRAATAYRVTLVPCFVLLVDGREVNRLVGGASHDQLLQLFASAGYRLAGPAPRGNQAPSVQPVSLTNTAPRPVASTPQSAGPPAVPSPSAPPVQPGSASPAPSANAVQQLALQATVRIRVEDQRGQSVGTGTMIDTHDGEALVATCGHIFRDSAGKGLITVDVSVGGQVRTVRGQLVNYDLARDIGFVSIVPGAEIRPVRVAPAGYALNRGEAVFSIGCNHGAEPTIFTSQITAIDKYLGAPNIEVAGQPVDGRSGGGLFSRDGLLIGICNAADPADKEGIYAGLSAIHWQLDQIGQRSLYQVEAPKPRLAAGGGASLAEPPRREIPPPAMPAAMSATPATNLTSHPAANLGTADTEIICIIRSKGQPHGHEQLLVLPQPTAGLLERLLQESRPQDRSDAEIKLQASSEPRGPAAWARPLGNAEPVGGNIVRAQSVDP